MCAHMVHTTGKKEERSGGCIEETYDELEYLLCEDSIIAPIEHPYRLPRAGLDELGLDLCVA